MLKGKWCVALVAAIAAVAVLVVPTPAQAAPGTTWVWVRVVHFGSTLIEAHLLADTFAGDCTQHTGQYVFESSVIYASSPAGTGLSDWRWHSITSTSADSDDIWWGQFEFWTSDRLVARTAKRQGPTMTERGVRYRGLVEGKLPMHELDFQSIEWMRWIGSC
jgi:hypothetical protein